MRKSPLFPRVLEEAGCREQEGESHEVLDVQENSHEEHPGPTPGKECGVEEENPEAQPGKVQELSAAGQRVLGSLIPINFFRIFS